jgi:hypothetical protein
MAFSATKATVTADVGRVNSRESLIMGQVSAPRMPHGVSDGSNGWTSLRTYGLETAAQPALQALAEGRPSGGAELGRFGALRGW